MLSHLRSILKEINTSKLSKLANAAWSVQLFEKILPSQAMNFSLKFWICKVLKPISTLLSCDLLLPLCKILAQSM
jgi:hypothetical protein